MKKRLILAVLTSIMSLFIIGGCAKTPGKMDENKEDFTIVTSFYPMYIHAINIAKDIPGVKVLNMTEPQTGCLHDYQLSPDDIKTLNGADVFVINGGGMESFMEKVISQLSNMPIINASENIHLLEAVHHGHHPDDGHDHDFNPHVWVSVSGAIDQVKQISQELVALDPGHKDFYQENTQNYLEKLEGLKAEMHAALDDLPNKNIVTFHEAFPYFAKEFNLTIVGTIVEEPGNEPSAKDLSKIIASIKDHKVKAIFTEPQFTSKAAQLISKEAGVPVYRLDPVVTGGIGKEEEDAYLNKMRDNLKNLEEALR